MKQLTNLHIPRWVDALWLCLLALYILAGVQFVPLHGDESTQIYMARDFYTLFIEHDPSRLSYQTWDTLDSQAATQQDLRLKDGVLHRYLFGAVAYLGGYTVNDLNEQWVWGAGWDWNHQNGHVPPDDLLFRARYLSASLLALGAIVLFIIANQLGGRSTAYIATLLYAISPALLLNGRRAMMESTMTLFSLLIVLAGIWVIQSRKWWAFALLGLCSGLAVASKHTSAVTVAAIFFACLLIFLHQAWRVKSAKIGIQPITYLLSAGILSLAVFYALNPAWWSNPIARVAEVSDIRLDFMQSQQDTFGGYANLNTRVNGFFRQTFGMQNTYAETGVDNFVENLAPEIETYEASRLGGFINTGSPLVPLIYMGLACLGIVALWFDATIPANRRFLIGVWVAAMMALTLLLTPLEWQRYYLPAYPAVMLMAGFGTHTIIKTIHQRIQ